MNALQRAEGLAFIVSMIQNCSDALADEGRFTARLLARRASGEGLTVTDVMCNRHLNHLVAKYREQADRLHRFAAEIETLRG